MSAIAQLTPLLANRDLDRLARLRINARRRFTNRARGEHLAAKGGTSTEFCDYRDYAPGDDVRFVDWNIFARIERPYLKQFHQEEELHVAVLLDASNSMLFEGKFDLARQLATALGVVGHLAFLVRPILGRNEIDIHREPRFAIVHRRDRAGDHVAHAGAMQRLHKNTEQIRLVHGDRFSPVRRVRAHQTRVPRGSATGRTAPAET